MKYPSHHLLKYEKLNADLTSLNSNKLIVVIKRALEIINAHEKVDKDQIDIGSIIKVYRINFDNYITPEMSFEDYQDQLVEAEARAFAKLFAPKEAE